MEYVVEKILKKQFNNNDEVEYRIKWENFSNQHNTWERSENLTNCNELLNEFEMRWGKAITGVRKNDSNLFVFNLIFKSNDTREISMDDAKMKWPLLTTCFLEKALVWVKPTEKEKEVSSAADGMQEAENPMVNPDEIVYATHSNSHVHKIWYLLKWPNNQYKFISSAEAKKKFNNLLFDFLAGQLKDSCADGFNAQNKYQKRRHRVSVFVKPKIGIKRNSLFEVFLMKRTNGNGMVRSRSQQNLSFDNGMIHHEENVENASGNDVIAQDQETGQNDMNGVNQNTPLRIIKNIPIGAKGRKRAQSMFAIRPVLKDDSDVSEDSSYNAMESPSALTANQTEEDNDQELLTKLNDCDELITPVSSPALLAKQTFDEVLLIDFSEPLQQSSGSQHVQPLPSNNLTSIMRDLEGIDFSDFSKAGKQLHRHHKKGSLPKGYVTQMIMNRVDGHRDVLTNEEIEEAHKTSDNEQSFDMERFNASETNFGVLNFSDSE